MTRSQKRYLLEHHRNQVDLCIRNADAYDYLADAPPPLLDVDDYRECAAICRTQTKAHRACIALLMKTKTKPEKKS